MLKSWDSERTRLQTLLLRIGVDFITDPTTKNQLRLFQHLTRRELTSAQCTRLEHAIAHLPSRDAAAYLDYSICRQQTGIFTALCAQLSQLPPQDLPTLAQRLEQCREDILALPGRLPHVQTRRNERHYRMQVASHVAQLESRLSEIEALAATVNNAPATDRERALDTFKLSIAALVH